LSLKLTTNRVNFKMNQENRSYLKICRCGKIEREKMVGARRFELPTSAC
jgi:translation initiation factor 2 beta subunit (eIF-2beta)/eIF-5